MSTIYVTADEIIVFMTAVAIAVVPMIIWRSWRASRIRIEKISNERRGVPDVARVEVELGGAHSVRLTPDQRTQPVGGGPLSPNARRSLLLRSRQVRSAAMAKLHTAVPDRHELSAKELEQINAQLDVMLRKAEGGGRAR
jgi:hypothetical protein